MDENKAKVQFEVARVLLEHSTKNNGSLIDFDVIIAALPNENPSDIEQVCFDFDYQGFLKASGVIGKAIAHVQLCPSFFVKFQPIFGNTNPNIDASEVARELLAQQKNNISAQELEGILGWDDRLRFNQAFALVVESLPEHLKSNEIQSDYPTKYVMLTPETRAILNRFIDMYS